MNKHEWWQLFIRKFRLGAINVTKIYIIYIVMQYIQKLNNLYKESTITWTVNKNTWYYQNTPCDDSNFWEGSKISFPSSTATTTKYPPPSATLHASTKAWTLWGYQFLIALTDILPHSPLHRKHFHLYSHTSSITIGLTYFIEVMPSDHPDPYRLDTPFVPQPKDCT